MTILKSPVIAILMLLRIIVIQLCISLVSFIHRSHYIVRVAMRRGHQHRLQPLLLHQPNHEARWWVSMSLLVCKTLLQHSNSRVAGSCWGSCDLHCQVLHSTRGGECTTKRGLGGEGTQWYIHHPDCTGEKHHNIILERLRKLMCATLLTPFLLK